MDLQRIITRYLSIWIDFFLGTPNPVGESNHIDRHATVVIVPSENERIRSTGISVEAFRPC